MLSKGSMAMYYGGEEILPKLSDLPASPFSPAFMGFSMLFQLSFIVFKKLKFRKVSDISNYHNQLANTILSGFSNVYNILSMVVFSAAGCVFIFIHYIAIDNENDVEEVTEVKEDEHKDLEKIPFSIYFFASILLSLNLAVYKKNLALRGFLIKKFQTSIQALAMNHRKKKNKFGISRIFKHNKIYVGKTAADVEKNYDDKSTVKNPRNAEDHCIFERKEENWHVGTSRKDLILEDIESL